MTDAWTLGHSTRTLDDFTGALQAHRIEVLVDVRRFPHSRRHTHFNTDELKKSLFHAGVKYEYLGDELGGFRKARPGSKHTALQESSFQGYADHMETAMFRRGLETILHWAKAKRVAYMCSESNFKSCHRRLISDALTLLHGVAIHHIVNATTEVAHEPFREARVEAGRVLYARVALEEFGDEGAKIPRKATRG